MANPNIEMKHKILKKGRFTFESAGDVCFAVMDNMKFEKIGELSLFTFKGKANSRRSFRYMCKKLAEEVR